MVTNARSALKISSRAAGDLAIVGYTSGTTGLPKGAMISQRALTGCVRLMPSLFRISSYGRCAFTGTLSFVSSIWGVILPHLYTGGTVTFLHPYTPESWADHVEADASTFTYAPTPFIPAFAEQLRRRAKALGCLESVIHSGSPVPRSHVQDLVDVIGERYIEVWGMTEGVAPFSATTRDDWRTGGQAEDVYASAGRASPTALIRAVGPDGRILPPGEEGELTVQADILFDGYLGDATRTAPEKPAESFGPHGFRTGDLGRLDAAGYVYVTGRVKDLIISGGLSPGDVDVFEFAEAFAALCLRFRRDLGAGPERMNPNGGTIAMGHAFGATGAILLGCVVDELERRGGRYGVAAVSGAAGLGVAVLVERVTS